MALLLFSLCKIRNWLYIVEHVPNLTILTSSSLPLGSGSPHLSVWSCSFPPGSLLPTVKLTTPTSTGARRSIPKVVPMMVFLCLKLSNGAASTSSEILCPHKSLQGPALSPPHGFQCPLSRPRFIAHLAVPCIHQEFSSLLLFLQVYVPFRKAFPKYPNYTWSPFYGAYSKWARDVFVQHILLSGVINILCANF